MSARPPASRRSPPAPDNIYTVSGLNREARRLVEGQLGTLWVEGEISNLARPASGHIYFSLKDGSAQVRCAMFRGANRKLAFRPTDGNQVLVQAKAGIYEARGEFQLVVEHMEAAGEGALRRKFEELKARLSEAGLFAEEHKQTLPTLPGCIGVVTSPTGAAVRDILNILRRRYPTAEVVIYPTRVQGEGAAHEIADAIATADTRSECDVLIISRGGGSLEDLWSFNEEVVAQAIFACKLPTVAGVGHETDVTIADLVADVRAPTPSGAAELVVPDRQVLLDTFAAMERRVGMAVRRGLTGSDSTYKALQHRLQRMHPGAVLDQSRQRLDELQTGLLEQVNARISAAASHQGHLARRLRSIAPAARLQRLGDRLAAQRRNLGREMQQRLGQSASRFGTLSAALHTVSPLATLQRGYAIVQTEGDNDVLRNAADVKPGERISARLAQGTVIAKVEKTRDS